MNIFKRKTEEEKGKVWTMMEDVDNARTWAGKCPNCGGKDYLEGPRGGISVNIECAKCGLRWNANAMGFSWQYIGRRNDS